MLRIAMNALLAITKIINPNSPIHQMKSIQEYSSVDVRKLVATIEKEGC